MELFVVGQYKHKTEKGPIWDFSGVYDDEAKAINACLNENYFVGSVILNTNLPNENIIWPNAYYPIKVIEHVPFSHPCRIKKM